MNLRLNLRKQSLLTLSTLLIGLSSSMSLGANTWDGMYPVAGKNCSASGKKIQLVTVQTSGKGAMISFYATPYISDDGLVLGKSFGNGDFSYQSIYKKRDTVKFDQKELSASSVFLDSKSRPRKDPNNEYVALTKEKKDGSLSITASTLTKDIHCTASSHTPRTQNAYHIQDSH